MLEYKTAPCTVINCSKECWNYHSQNGKSIDQRGKVHIEDDEWLPAPTTLVPLASLITHLVTSMIINNRELTCGIDHSSVKMEQDVHLEIYVLFIILRRS